MGKVGITGGAGFIGSNLAQHLTQLGYEVVIVDDLSTGLLGNVENQNVDFQQFSILDKERLIVTLKDCEAIFHLAARGSVPRSIKNPTLTHDVNTTGTLNVLEVARESGAHVIFSSSSSVYGRNTSLPKNELMWTGPLTPYAASKLGAESYVQAYSSSFNVPTTLFRFFNVYGPRQRPDHEYAAVIPKWIWKAMSNQEIEIFGDGKHSRDFTYIDSVVDVLTIVLRDKVTFAGPINLAFGERISLQEIVNILKIRFPNLRVRYGHERPGDIKESQNSPELLKELFPSVIQTPFSISLNKTVDWLIEEGHSVARGPSVPD